MNSLFIDTEEIRGLLEEAIPDIGAAAARKFVEKLKQKTAERGGSMAPHNPSTVLSQIQNVTYPALTNGIQEIEINVPADAVHVLGIALYRTDTNIQEFDIGIKWASGQDIHQLRTHRDYECKDIQISDRRYKSIDSRKVTNRLILQTNFNGASVNPIAYQAVIYYLRA